METSDAAVAIHGSNPTPDADPNPNPSPNPSPSPNPNPSQVAIQGMWKGRSTRQEVAERRRRDKAGSTLSRGGTQWLARKALKAAQESNDRRERDTAALRMQASPNRNPNPNHNPNPNPGPDPNPVPDHNPDPNQAAVRGHRERLIAKEQRRVAQATERAAPPPRPPRRPQPAPPPRRTGGGFAPARPTERPSSDRVPPQPRQPSGAKPAAAVAPRNRRRGSGDG